jgi:uncharacterized protein YbcV (DUF1398 family)
MFTLKQIEVAHSKVKSGADFPEFIGQLKTLGIKRYTVFVQDGHTKYSDEAGFSLHGDALYLPLTIAENNPALFEKLLRKHQAGETDYQTFCHDAAKSGIEKWTVDTEALICTYFHHETIVLIEHIPHKDS